MVDNLLKLREPAAVVLLVVLALRVVLGVVELASSGVAVLGGRAALGAVDVLDVVLLVLLVGLCVLKWPSPHARPLTLSALVVTGLVVACALVEVVVLVRAGVVGGGPGWVENLLGVVLAVPIPVLALVALTRLLPTRAATVTAPLSVTASSEESPVAIEAPRQDPEQQPTWQVDQAAGVAWLTAGDAATGASATRWGTPGATGGWQPEIGPGLDDPAVPGRPTPGPPDQSASGRDH